jgi:uncharacterized protein (TIGR00730 family)
VLARPDSATFASADPATRRPPSGSICATIGGVTAQPRRILVFCGASHGVEPLFRETATELGAAIATSGHELVYGGGRVGLMGVVADAALAGGAAVTGVMTEQLVGLEIAHSGLTTLEIRSTMHERKARMVELADGVIVLPGGFGTFDEAFEVLTWNQLGVISTPVVFLDVGGFFRPLFELVAAASAAGFVSSAHAHLARRAGDVAEAVHLACAPAAGYSPKWVDAPR